MLGKPVDLLFDMLRRAIQLRQDINFYIRGTMRESHKRIMTVLHDQMRETLTAQARQALDASKVKIVQETKR